jgi:hypothetical protein
MTAVTAWTAGTTRAEGGQRRTTGPTGAHARGKRSTWEERWPLSRRKASRTLGTERAEHAMVVAMVVMDRDCGAGEEDNRHHENDAGNNHHPGRDLVQPRRPRSERMRWRRRDRGGRRDLRFRYLGHLSIMPRQLPAIKHCLAHVARRRFVLAAEGPDEPQDNHRDQGDSGNDRYPGRGLVEPFMFGWRRGQRRRGWRRRNRRLSCLAHASHNASGRHRLRVESGREACVSPQWSGARRPHCVDAGLVVMETVHPKRIKATAAW